MDLGSCSRRTYKFNERNNMKVAVLITGQLRDYQINYMNHMRHLIEPNNADVFVYACNKNTIHTNGSSLEQKYCLTTQYTKEEIEESVMSFYSSHLKKITVNEEENLPDYNFGTLGYFRTRMQNQIDNIGNGYKMAVEYSKNRNFKYDVVVRCRPDNSFFPFPIDFSNVEIKKNTVYSTIFLPSRHRDLCFFAAATPEAFSKYVSYKYLYGYDPNNTVDNFKNTEHSWEDYLKSIEVDVRYIGNLSVPFYGEDKSKPITDFPFRNKRAKLIDINLMPKQSSFTFDILTMIYKP